MQYRTYGDSGPRVMLVHGGPGAPGSMAPIGRALASKYRVIEPLQRRSLPADAPGSEKLTVSRHIADMHHLIADGLHGEAPAIIGHSWGALLTLAFAAAHPDKAGPLVLIAPGTFDEPSRARFYENMAARMDEATRVELAQLAATEPDPDRRMDLRTPIYVRLYSFDSVTENLEQLPCDARGNKQTWDDMLRLQRQGVYPAAFSRITSPVLMLYGEHEPYPGEMIHASLVPHIPQLECVRLERCGHFPWIERAASEIFYAALTHWLKSKTPRED